MIKLIVGNKGSGKTKALINMVNNASKTSKGNVVCIEKGQKHIHDVEQAVRLINIEDFNIDSYRSLYGFLTGILASNYDITDIFVDGTFKICEKNFEELSKLITLLVPITQSCNVGLTFALSCDISEISDDLKVYSIDY